MSSEDLSLKRYGEVQEAAELDSEAATLEARAKDLRVQAQEWRSVVTQLDLQAADTFQQISKFIPWRRENSSRSGQTLGIFVFRVRSC
ncbi:hypothetical protein LIER_38322 [Lithospermum erythrorhizon]|uniref:Uncharacterized protein n=1 Tax=Lithospermum erythrorhizon TaxID=34254 RepID=A0AAV3PZH6_LITER